MCVVRVCGRSPKISSARQRCAPSKICSSHLHGLSKVAAVGFCEWYLLTPSLCCHAAFIPASTPGPAHQPCAPRGCLEGGTSSAAVESTTSTMLVRVSLMQVPSGISGSAPIIAFVTWHRRFGSVINHLRSARIGVSLVLSLFLRAGADPRGMRTFVYTRLCSKVSNSTIHK